MHRVVSLQRISLLRGYIGGVQEDPATNIKTQAPSEPSKVPMDELLLILNPSKTGRTAISVQSYSLELTWEQLPVISEQVERLIYSLAVRVHDDCFESHAQGIVVRYGSWWPTSPLRHWNRFSKLFPSTTRSSSSPLRSVFTHAPVAYSCL